MRLSFCRGSKTSYQAYAPVYSRKTPLNVLGQKNQLLAPYLATTAAFSRCRRFCVPTSVRTAVGRQEWYGGDEDWGADFDDDIHMLTSFSLVEMSADGHEFEMHRLVQFSIMK